MIVPYEVKRLNNEKNNQPKESEKEWRLFFSEKSLSRAREFVDKGYVRSFACDERQADAMVMTRKDSGFAVRIQNAPDSYGADWDPSSFSCNCASKSVKSVGNWPNRRNVHTCPHEAAVLLYWEDRRGPWRFRETEEEMSARLERERIEEELRLERKRIQEEERRERERVLEERARRLEQKRAEQKKLLSAQDFFPIPEDNTFFHVRLAVEKRKTNLYARNRAEALLKDGIVEMNPPHVFYDDDDGEQVIQTAGTVRDSVNSHRTAVTLSARNLKRCVCDCQGGWYDRFSLAPLCEHELVLLTKLREYIQERNPGDATDRAADALFQAMDAVSVPATDDPSRKAEKERNFILTPRIIMDDGAARLSFKAGFSGGKALILRSYLDFLDAVENEKTFPLSKAVAVDFSKSDFTEDSMQWLRFLQRRVSETETANEQLERKSGGSWYYQRTPTLSVGVRDILIGANLDRFYDLAEGTDCEFQDKSVNYNGTIHIGHMPMRVRLASKRISGLNGGFEGVEVTGEMPVILRGSAGSYIFNHNGLSRITREEEQFIRPFRDASDQIGKIRFRVGTDHLAEFYYRVIPRFMESPFIDFDDSCASEAETLLPPEPYFTFRIDIENENIICDALVSYGEKSRPLLEDAKSGEYRDRAQEERVIKILRKYFTLSNPANPDSFRFREKLTDENLYRVLTEGIADMEHYGATLGSDAFRRASVRPAPRFKIGVSIESGLLDISVLSQDADPAELLDLLESYRQKKTFHRLKSGEFVTLSGNEQIAALKEFTDALDVTADDVILRGAELPLYRALYLDKLLEAHDALASNRDRTYRALIRNFASVRDADYEIPEALGEVLRPYQIYGYKWLRTLAEAGFGGILADEMGLGKTVQTIALIQALREDGDQNPMLIVCPASLVFNWQEEFTRFAPGLSVIPVAGAAAARKDILNDLRSRDGDKTAGIIYITSYDLLRKDAALYENAEFSVMILDEAQYIKNQKAAMTKAAKGIRARRRFALTGTPIENRLSELWSVFDFLMPGFLYGYTDFSRRFETPIVKNKDPSAIDRLKRMTGPFILRRLKTDVLKDLPAKLEEVRYSRFETEQRKIYDGQVIRMKQMLSRSGETEKDKIKIFAELTRIRQICCDPSLLLDNYNGGSAKRDACLELIRNAIGGGHRMLVFSQFTSMLALLEEDLNRENILFYKITGATPKEQRLRLVRDFNEGDVPVFLISLKAGGTGLNLVGADMVIHYDPWWNMAAQNQATDRAHRIGQTRQVTVYRMIVKDTIEEKILALQESKRDLADAVLSGESASLASLSNEELMELLS